MLMTGKKAPEFTLDGIHGNGDFGKFSLADLRGKWVVLYFYPLDFTGVCNSEILQFSECSSRFEEANTAVLGCSIDSKFSHQQWVKKGGLGELKHPLLSDMTHETAKAYQAYIEPAGIATRATFVIDPSGTIQYAAYHTPVVGRSVDEILRVLQALQTGDYCPANWKKGQATLGKA